MLTALIVDDEAPSREELKALLTSAPDIEIVGECANAIEGLSAVHRLRPDVLFLDINMPAMNGFEVLQQLRSVHPNLHVIMISASSTLENVRTAAKFGVNGFVVKPFTPDKVLNSLKSIK